MNQPPSQSPTASHRQPEEVHLRDYLNIIRSRRKVFILTFLAVFCAVAVYTFTMKPVYEAYATLHVKDEKSKTGMLGELALSEMSPVDSEIEIIKARTNTEQVVKRLHLDWRVTKKSDGLSFTLLDFTSTVKEPVYRIDLTGGDGYKVWNTEGTLVGIGKSGVLMKGKGVSLRIDGLRGKSGDSFQLELLPFNATVKGLQDGIVAAESGKKTNIIRISFRDNDPALARDVDNSLVQAYLEKTVALKAEEASKTVEFIDEQLNGVRQELDKAELELQRYKSSTGMVKLDTEAEELIKKFSETEKEQAGVILQKKQMQFALASLNSTNRRGVVYSPAAVMANDPLVAGMATKLADLEVQKRALLNDYTREHPAVKAIQGQIDELQKKIRATYETSLRNLAKQENDIAGRLTSYENNLKHLPEAERDLARLVRLAKVNSDIYTFLLQKHEEARIAKASTISNIDIVDPAFVPDKPVKPKKAKNLILGLLVSCMLSIGLAFFQDYLDDSLKDMEEVKRVLGMPVLGVIPFISHQAQGDAALAETLVAYLAPQSPAAEAFRSLRTALHFAGTVKGNKCLLLTSGFPDEGKTTISSNLAVILAQTGARVVLVGCDLRRPSLHEMFKTSRSPGLSEVLAGDQLLDRVVRSTGSVGIDFISAGSLPPNPAELLGSRRMQEVMAKLRERYDHVVIDAAPMLSVSDTQVLTPLIDLVVVVLEAGRVPRKAGMHIRELLQATDVAVAGVVLNDKTGKGFEYYGYGENYYGSGYGYYGEKKEVEQKKSWWKRLGRKA